MNGLAPFIPFVAIAVLIIALLVYAAAMAKRRTEAWRRVADDLGLFFLGKENDLLQRFGHLRLLSRGHSRRITNVLSGSASHFLGPIWLTCGECTPGPLSK